MATKAQFKANLKNSQKSKGPVSPQGKAASSRNHLTTGLYTMNDFVLPEELDLYKLFCIRLEESCDAGDAIEECLSSEITSAAWRLRRCNIADGDVAQHSALEPLLDTTLEKQIRSIERARSHSTSIFHRGLTQLRKLQKERASLRPEFLQQVQQKLDGIMNEPAPDWNEIDRQIAEDKAKTAESASNCNPAETNPEKLASNCKPASTPSRGRPCPCKSGNKFKHCCGKNTPWQSNGTA
jgi:hypothetical protein